MKEFALLFQVIVIFQHVQSRSSFLRPYSWNQPELRTLLELQGQP